MFLSLAGAILCSHLGSKRSAFTGAFEALGTRGGPSHHITHRVGNGDNGIVKRCLNMGNAIGDILLLFFFLTTFLGAAMLPPDKFCG